MQFDDATILPRLARKGAIENETQQEFVAKWPKGNWRECMIGSRSAKAGSRLRVSTGFVTVSSLRQTRCQAVPEQPGVYVVLRTSETEARWLQISPGGHFKGRDPSVPVSVLQQRLVKGTPVVYIGKADLLRRRLDQYMQFGAGVPIGHWGGRYIWQLADSDDLEVAWLLDPNPRKQRVRDDRPVHIGIRLDAAGQSPAMTTEHDRRRISDRAGSPSLDDLLARARDAEPGERIKLRDAVGVLR